MLTYRLFADLAEVCWLPARTNVTRTGETAAGFSVGVNPGIAVSELRVS